MLDADPSCCNRPDSGVRRVTSAGCGCRRDPALTRPRALSSQGYLALQWAALNNRVAAATVLLERGADVNGVDGQGQTALHWAAVRGAVPASELLLRAGARLDRADSRGYTAMHVAAQYGHTPVLYHFAVRWGTDVEVLDSDGRTPLHWTAYKGFPDSLRLLLFLNADALRADREGCTPLHWCAPTHVPCAFRAAIVTPNTCAAAPPSQGGDQGQRRGALPAGAVRRHPSALRGGQPGRHAGTAGAGEGAQHAV